MRNEGVPLGMEKVVSVALIFLSVIVLAVTSGYMGKTEKIINGAVYEKIATENSFAVNTRIAGGKKFGADMLFVKQVLDVGGDRNLTSEQIKATSEAIMSLDPYFIANYTFSGMVVGMIRVFDKIDYGLDILNIGIKYNSDEWILKYYLSGLIAYSKGNEDTLLVEFEKISRAYKDDMILNTMAYIYENKYKRTNDVLFLQKAAQNWEKLLDAKGENYRKIALRKLKEYKLIN